MVYEEVISDIKNEPFWQDASLIEDEEIQKPPNADEIEEVDDGTALLLSDM